MVPHETYLKMAIETARSGIRKRAGGPFGAVIVRDGRVMGKGYNTVVAENDPTAHAEINAIRHACRELGDHHLTGSVIYTNFEPCPMCLAAIYWADIRVCYFSAGRRVAENLGFLDRMLYKEMALPASRRQIRTACIKLDEMEDLLKEWDAQDGKILY